MWSTLLDVVLFLTSLFLILLVLVQRGKGGGLAGALGGSGGYSAFGTRAGDMFTKITIGVAGFWLALAISSVLVHQSSTSVFGGRTAPPPATDAETRPVGNLPEGGAPGALPDLNPDFDPTGLPELSPDTLLPKVDDPAAEPPAETETRSKENAETDPGS